MNYNVHFWKALDFKFEKMENIVHLVPEANQYNEIKQEIDWQKKCQYVLSWKLEKPKI
jgi:hypothetical protein